MEITIYTMLLRVGLGALSTSLLWTRIPASCWSKAEPVRPINEDACFTCAVVLSLRSHSTKSGSRLSALRPHSPNKCNPSQHHGREQFWPTGQALSEMRHS